MTKTMQSMVCGVDCKPGDQNCNGYCEGRSSSPPNATEEQKLDAARQAANKALDVAEKAWFAYAGMCEVGRQRELAFRVYNVILYARRF